MLISSLRLLVNRRLLTCKEEQGRSMVDGTGFKPVTKTLFMTPFILGEAF